MSERPKVGTYVGVYGQREPRDYEVQIEWLEARLVEAEVLLRDIRRGEHLWVELNERIDAFLKGNERG